MMRNSDNSSSSASFGHQRDTWVMGIPVNPNTLPVTQQAPNWFSQGAAPSTPQMSSVPQQQQYIQYSGPPPLPPGNVAYYNQAMPPQANPYVPTAPAFGSSGQSPTGMILGVFGKWGKIFDHTLRNAESLPGNVWNHLRTGPNLTETAMGKIAQGTRVLTEGGYEKVFRQMFETVPGEQLQKTYACYLSNSTGPVIGTLYLSTMKLAFCSDNPLTHNRYPGQTEWSYYKVVVPLSQLRAVNPSANNFNPAEKYIQIITTDNHEFWFMGFVTYDKALKNLQRAVRHQGSQLSTRWW